MLLEAARLKTIQNVTQQHVQMDVVTLQEYAKLRVTLPVEWGVEDATTVKPQTISVKPESVSQKGRNLLDVTQQHVQMAAAMLQGSAKLIRIRSAEERVEHVTTAKPQITSAS